MDCKDVPETGDTTAESKKKITIDTARAALATGMNLELEFGFYSATNKRNSEGTDPEISVLVTGSMPTTLGNSSQWEVRKRVRDAPTKKCTEEQGLQQ